MLPLSYFKNSTFLGSNLVGIAVAFGLFGMLFFLSLFMQQVQGYSPTEAGVRQLPSTLAVMVAAVLSGRIVGRIGARVPMTIGMTLTGAAILAFTTVEATTPYGSYWWILTVMGIGVGLVMSPVTSAIMSTVPPGRAGVASGTLNTARQVGGVFGIAVLGSILFSQLVSQLRGALTTMGLPPFIIDQAIEYAKQGRRPAAMPSMPGVDVAAIETAAAQSFTYGLHTALWAGGAIVLVGAILSAVMIRGTSPEAQRARHGETQVRGISGDQAVAQDLAEDDAPAES
jgi:MFS family permease